MLLGHAPVGPGTSYDVKQGAMLLSNRQLSDKQPAATCQAR